MIKIYFKYFKINLFSTYFLFSNLYNNNGDVMKYKNLFPVLGAIVIGCLLGVLFFNLRIPNESYAKENNVYYLQYGVYTSVDTMQKNAYQLDNYIYERIDNKYYVYVGITSSSSNANKIKSLYKEKNIELYIKDSYISNPDFLNLLTQYDILLSDAINETDIISVNNVILTDYQELIINRD